MSISPTLKAWMDAGRPLVLTYDQHRALMTVLAEHLANPNLDASERRHIEDILALLRRP